MKNEMQNEECRVQNAEAETGRVQSAECGVRNGEAKAGQIQSAECGVQNGEAEAGKAENGEGRVENAAAAESGMADGRGQSPAGKGTANEPIADSLAGAEQKAENRKQKSETENPLAQAGANGPGEPGISHFGSQISEAAQDPTSKKRNVGKVAKYRRRGNVARLPKAVRDRLNEMIDDGVPYREIIERLGEDGKGLSRWNLGEWRKGGHKDWLAEQAFIRRTRARQETPADMVRDFDGTEVNHAALQLGTLHIFEALRDLGPGSLNEKLGGDCAAFARLLNALARASRETMALQKYREACAQARAALQPMLDPRRELTDDERHAIVRHVDRILGIDQYVHDFENQIPSLGIIRPDKGRVCPGGNSKPETRNSKEDRNPNSEFASPHSDGAEQEDII